MANQKQLLRDDCFNQASERDFEVGLSLTWRISLAGAASSAAVGLNETKVVGSVRNCTVRSADLHAVQHVEELHSQLHVYPLSGKQAFGQSEVFV